MAFFHLSRLIIQTAFIKKDKKRILNKVEGSRGNLQKALETIMMVGVVKIFI